MTDLPIIIFAIGISCSVVTLFLIVSPLSPIAIITHGLSLILIIVSVLLAIADRDPEDVGVLTIVISASGQVGDNRPLYVRPLVAYP